MLKSIFSLIISLSIMIFFLPVTFAHEEEAKLTFAPEVPPAINRREPATVKISLETTEIEGILKENEEGEPTKYIFWTYNNKVPGPFIRVRQGDTLELTELD